MDPSTIVVNTAALINTTAKVIGYLSSVLDASNDRQVMLLELCNSCHVLYTLQKHAKAEPSSLPNSLIFSTAQGPLQHLKRTLESLVDVMEPSKNRNKILSAFAWPLKKDEIHKILKTLEHQKSLIIMALQAEQGQLSRVIRNDVAALGDRMGDMNEKIANICTTQESVRIRKWLKAPDPQADYFTALRECCPGTGTWFLQKEGSLQWQRSSCVLIWLRGDLGYGKTFLSASILKHFRDFCSISSQAVLYFFFNDRHAQRHESQSMIRSLMQQVSIHWGGWPEEVHNLYSACGQGQDPPHSERLLAILHQQLAKYQGTYIILDALDECHDRHDLLKSIQGIASWDNASLHILVTSRRETDIQQSLGLLDCNVLKERMQREAVGVDIRTFVKYRLANDDKLKRWHKDSDMQQEIETTATSKAQGMFKWAACQLDQLRNALSVFEVRELLKTLPSDLDSTYSQILDSIATERAQYLLKVLKWLACSGIPITLRQAAEIITIDAAHRPRVHFDKRFRDVTDVLSICPSPITYQGGEVSASSILELSHSSVREYLIPSRDRDGGSKPYIFREAEAHAAIAHDCIIYLLDVGGWSAILGSRHFDYPLLSYAAWNWIEHAQEAVKDGNITIGLLVNDFLSADNTILRHWADLHCPPAMGDIPPLKPHMDIVFTQIGDLSRSVKRLLQHKMEPNDAELINPRTLMPKRAVHSCRWRWIIGAHLIYLEICSRAELT